MFLSRFPNADWASLHTLTEIGSLGMRHFVCRKNKRSHEFHKGKRRDQRKRLRNKLESPPLRSECLLDSVFTLSVQSMFFQRRKKKVFDSPIFVVDALGFSAAIERSDRDTIIALGRQLERHYHRLRLAIPFTLVINTARRVWGTREFSTFQLNDMFIIYSRVWKDDFALRYLITASLVYQRLLLDGFVPRGALGHGVVLAGEGYLIGSGFIDAYKAAEQRSEDTRNVCAIQISSAFIQTVPPSAHVQRLICFYRGHFFVNPVFLVDHVLGTFDRTAVLDRLAAAGANEQKLSATKQFLEEFEDYDAAAKPNSQSRQFMMQRRSEP